jgi:hypothetical protein
LVVAGAETLAQAGGEKAHEWADSLEMDTRHPGVNARAGIDARQRNVNDVDARAGLLVHHFA